MKIRLVFFLCFIISAHTLHAQVGASHINRMNVLLKIHGGENSSPLKYVSSTGFVEQKVAGYVDHFTISNIKRITVRDTKDGSTVELACDSQEACINHIAPDFSTSNLPGLTYFFNSNPAANEFAQLINDIIQKDFNERPYLVLTLDIPVSQPSPVQETKETQVSVAKTERVKTNKVSQGNHLSLGAYDDKSDENYEATLSEFGKKLSQVVTLAKSSSLGQLKGAENDGAYDSKLALPKAKRNYVYQFKNADCFIAEFDTKRDYEELEDLYFELKDEIEEALPEDFEAIDMAFQKIYENSDDEVFHTEFYSNENPNSPSIVIRIAPDGKKNTLFVRVGKK